MISSFPVATQHSQTFSDNDSFVNNDVSPPSSPSLRLNWSITLTRFGIKTGTVEHWACNSGRSLSYFSLDLTWDQSHKHSKIVIYNSRVVFPKVGRAQEW